jgi:hypothetical protein
VVEVKLFWGRSDSLDKEDVMSVISAIDGMPDYAISSYQKGEQFVFLGVEFFDMCLEDVVDNIEMQGQLYNIEMCIKPSLNGMYRLKSPR